MAAMDAYNHLTEWKSLQYCSTVNIDETSPPNLERMWSEPIYQVIEILSHVTGRVDILQVLIPTNGF